MSDRPEHLLVDGYNVIKTVPYFHHFERTNLERARNALWQSLNAYAHRTGARVTLYFDGSDSVSFPPQQEHGSIQILFSKAPQLADDLIKEAVQQMHGAKRVRVISSDREIRNFARRHKIRSIASDEFFEELEAESAVSTPPTTHPEDTDTDDDIKLDEREIREWEDLFASGRKPKD
tara:strand:+ start:180 stop:710 length:531 start_codon:yes stop_codon:yes gene_type:complete